VVAREDVVLNPYYRHMGGLYGSEYWTYLLPRRVGLEMAARLTGPRSRRSGRAGRSRLGCSTPPSAPRRRSSTPGLGSWPNGSRTTPDFGRRFAQKRWARERDERRKPLSAYRTEELVRCRECFFGPDRATTRRAGASYASALRERRHCRPAPPRGGRR
jgi:putative two-component system hydrogenase maturation factor HypX/HoxX